MYSSHLTQVIDQCNTQLFSIIDDLLNRYYKLPVAATFDLIISLKNLIENYTSEPVCRTK